MYKMNKNINFERRNPRGVKYFTIGNSLKKISEQRNSALKARLESKASRLKTILELGALRCVFEPRKPYTPVNPWKSPPSLPQRPLTNYATPAFYLRLREDTLFFIFYYLPNTIQQKLAAKELRRLSWRFHKKYLAWFQRAEAPTKITETFEQGTFVYFDPEGSILHLNHTYTIFFAQLMIF
ncbi:uncharacterized protein TA03190 [Theileria annulata]|uniref:NOT2/NOT3/NOT5 C-terminal domain-containing protein n=1 Tax=Theileria annulata TaxID=5874 RepID=Q4UCZ4_THEAN|nr:uncharacterized protein TA03190 [Theileria annulata]CAI75307.1 hypothetical protein TA03190 [Theileria annulata]|eukprot:XP_954783.1 hypothetical protein TA03190 [Theileria annulata]